MLLLCVCVCVCLQQKENGIMHVESEEETKEGAVEVEGRHSGISGRYRQVAGSEERELDYMHTRNVLSSEVEV